ncbi:monoacylglycerol lipase ABHD2-like [Diadema antillarum]|uniref:monoacylglycerol lipase ABHD2-like n=1 Tax=Diadema antillarum TaxID=105358 RepID=UPI003A89FF53
MGLFVIAAIILLVIYFAIRVLNLLDQPAAPTLHFKDTQYNHSLLSLCSILTKPYVPNRLWGHNAHIQSFIYAKLGRFNAPRPAGTRIRLPRPDGATVTFDLFEPTASHPQAADITLCVCPGIANHSEKAYVRTFIQHSMSHGFRVAVLNHLGALPEVPLTSPRIFTYGETGEYAAMVDYIREHHPSSKLVALGFSMGANIVVKYVGEEPSRQDDLMCCISVCQGYDVTKASKVLHEWESMRRFYNFMMTLNMLRQLRRNFDMLFGEGAKLYWEGREETPPCYNVDKVFGATSLVHLDEELTRKMARHNSLSEFYKECSSCQYLFKIKIPLLMLNSGDDAIIPVSQNHSPREYSQRSPCAVYAVTKHGGHLGFFEGGFLRANTVSWMDRALMQYVDAVVELEGSHAVSNGEAPHCNGATS